MPIWFRRFRLKVLLFVGTKKPKTESIVLPKKPVVPEKFVVKPHVASKVIPPRPHIVLPPVRRSMLPRALPTHARVTPPHVKSDVGLSQDYGDITPLLNDPSISTIECQGEGRPLMIIRAGQRQPTKVVLRAAEIKEILEKVSDSVHIPILEGVFRAAVDNFSINAVVSDIIGSRFVIKKQNAYALLEG